MQEKRINFYSPNLEKNYRDFLEKRSDIQELESDYEKRIAFAGSLLFDYNGESDISKAGSEIQIGNFIQDPENDFGIDLIWYDSNVDSKKHPIVFLKYFDVSEEEYNGDIKNYLRDQIEKSISGSVLIAQKWKQWKEANIKLDNPNIESIIDQIDQMIQEIDDESNKKISFSLAFVFGNLHEWENSLNAIIETTKKNVQNYDKVIYKLDKNKKNSFGLFFEKNLEDNYNKIVANRSCIDKDHLIIDQPNNILNYNIDSHQSKIVKAAIVNVSAKSIHTLWNKPNYKENLLGLNLRYHIKKNKAEKEVDSHIQESMNSESNNQFWFKNNGLVIICSNFEIQNNQLILENFSIVNGGQTTANIGGEFKKDDFKDFFVTTKIIAVEGMNGDPDNEVTEIANEIAEATNSQKPIKKEDLLVNMQEIKNVRRLFEKNNPDKISMKTRRGEPNPREDWFPHNWQKIEYSKIVQLAAAFETIKPGTARNGKATLINEKNAKEIFGDFVKNNIPTYVELIKFNYVLNQLDKKTFSNKLIKDSEFATEYELKKTKVDNYFKYCKFFSVSLIRILKIFLTFKDSIKEYRAILEDDWSDSDRQKRITEWSKKWWNQIGNKSLFINSNIEQIQKFWVRIILKKLFKYFAEMTKDSSATNIAKNNKSFYYEFMDKIIDEFEDNKELYKENIVVEEIDGSLNE